MKKIYFSIFAIASAFVMNAQVTVTLQVDMSDYVKVAGNTLKTVKVAGNFADQSATSLGTAMENWAPPKSPTFTKVAGTTNTWQAKITFPNAAKGQEVVYKFLNTADSWGTCDVDQECFTGSTVNTCNQGSGDFNRVLKVPTANATYGYKWNTCTSLVRASDLILDNEISISPNPANDFTIVEIKNGTGAYSVEVTTIAGQSVQRFENITDKAIIEDLNSGLYFVVIRNAEGKFQTQKLVIE